MNKKIISVISSAALMALPVVAFAFDAGPIPGQKTYSEVVEGIISVLWPLVAAATVIIFFYAAFMFVTAAGDPEKVNSARQALVWSAVGVIVSIVAVSIPTIIKTLSGLG